MSENDELHTLCQTASRLATALLQVHFGDDASAVGAKLLSTNGRSVTLAELCRALRPAVFPPAIRSSLMLLMQQNLVLRDSSHKTGAAYLMRATDVTLRLRFPRFILHARDTFGAEGAAVTEELMLHGQLCQQALVEKVAEVLVVQDIDASRLSTDEPTAMELAAASNEEVSVNPATLEAKREEVKRVWGLMVQKRYVISVAPLGRAVCVGNEAEFDENAAHWPIELQNGGGSGEDAAVAEPHTKRSRREGNVATASDVLWRVDFERFHADFRRRACADVVDQKFGASAKAVMEVMFEHTCADRVGALGEEALISAAEIHRRLRLRETSSSSSIDFGKLQQQLDLLCRDRVGIITRICEPKNGDGGQFAAHPSRIIGFLQRHTMHSILEDRYGGSDGGAHAARIYHVLERHRHLEQPQIAELSMIPQKDTRICLYRMLQDRLVSFQEVPRRVDHNPGATFFLWTVNARAVRLSLLDQLYKTMFNLYTRRRHEEQNGKELTEQRSESAPEGAEKAKLEQYACRLDRLDQALFRLDQVILLFNSFR